MIKQPARTSLSDFIKTTMGSQFVIPVYQRTYTWSPEKETAQMMDDIDRLLSGKTSNHFLGIIIYTDAKIAAMFRQLLIVDGQQRMTTSFIFLLALRKLALEKGDQYVAGMIDDYYLFNRHAMGDASFRLKPQVSNDDVFARLVYGSEDLLSPKEKQSNVFRNYESIYRRICQMARKHSLAEILDILSRIDVLQFPLADTDNAQQIFESINSTGAPLTSADLIRNYILMNHTNDLQERYYRMYWQPMEQAYPNSRALEDFFRYYLAIKTFSLPGRREVYEGFKNFWNAGKDATEKKLLEISRYCSWCYQLFDDQLEDTEAEEAMVNYRRMNARVTAPFLMEMMRLRNEEKITAHELAEIIRLLDSYIIRRALVGLDNGNLGAYFPTLLRNVLNAFRKRKFKNILQIVQTGLVEYNKGKALAMPRDEDVRQRLKEVNAYALSCIRAVLERMEHDGATAKVDLSALNIEHIMPQHPNRWWKYNSGTYDEDDYTFCANLIGNLTLCAVYDNTKMGNEDFGFKKDVLSRTMHIRMNTEILGCELWNRDVIVLRTQEMSDRVVELYPYRIAETYSEEVRVEEREEVQIQEQEAVTDATVMMFTTPTVNAKAFLYPDQKVEVLAGTVMKPYSFKEMKRYRLLFNTLRKDNMIAPEGDGKVRLTRNVRFNNMNEAACFLLHRGGENAGVWLNENGASIIPQETKAEEVSLEPAKEIREIEHRQGHSICINNAAANVHAVFVNPGEIDVLAGSIMKPYVPGDMRQYRSRFNEMKEAGILLHTDRSTVQFVKDYTFSSLDEAAGFVLHRGGATANLWTNENGKEITGPAPVMEQKQPEEKISGVPLILKNGQVDVHALFTPEHQVVVLKDSVLSWYGHNTPRHLRQYYDSLVTSQSADKNKKKVTVLKNLIFTSLDEASEKVTLKKNASAFLWTHADGRKISGPAPVYGQSREKSKITIRRFSKKKD